MSIVPSVYVNLHEHEGIDVTVSPSLTYLTVRLGPSVCLFLNQRPAEVLLFQLEAAIRELSRVSVKIGEP